MSETNEQKPQRFWAVVGPPTQRSRRRYIYEWTLAPTRRGAIRAFDQDAMSDALTYAAMRRQGLTVERVSVYVDASAA